MFCDLIIEGVRRTRAMNMFILMALMCGVYLISAADDNSHNAITCAVCTSNSHNHCDEHHATCVHHKCAQSELLINGHHEYRRYCDYHNYCEKSVHADHVLRLECCDSGDNCNRYSNPANVVYIKGASHQTQHHVVSTTPVPTPAPFFINKGLRCEVCSGELCGIFPGNDLVVTCPDQFPYCMNTVQNDISGNKITTKRCASQHECQTEWWDISSRRQDCINFDPSEIYIKTFSCNYCCLTSECNKYINPLQETLFRGV